MRPPVLSEITKRQRNRECGNVDSLKTCRLKEFQQRLGLTNWEAGGVVVIGGRRVEGDRRVPEGAHRLHLAGEVPDVGRDRASGAGDAELLAQASATVGHEIDSQTGDNNAGDVA